MKLRLYGGKFCRVDKKDFTAYRKHKWYVSSWGYAVRTIRRNGKKIMIRLHREIMNAPTGLQVDHINRDRLDNRRSNLRLCTHAENLRNGKVPKSNSCGIKGVSRNGSGYSAKIHLNRKVIHLGTFKTKEEAAKAYRNSIVIYHGEFASSASL